MKRVTLITAAAVLAVLTLFASNAVTQETNVSERTFLTFSNTFELPGLSLEPGTYVFKLADTPSRNVVQVWDREEKEMLGHWLFVQAERPRVTEDNVVMFREAPAGAPPAVQYWYFPGERIGKEFIYPKDQAERIAKATGTRVLTAESESASVSSVDAEGKITEWKREESTVAAAPSPDPSPVQPQAQAEPQPEPSPRAAAPEPAPRSPVGTSGIEQEGQTARADTLPDTSSPLALSGLLGLLSLIGAAGVRAYRK